MKKLSLAITMLAFALMSCDGGKTKTGESSNGNDSTGVSTTAMTTDIQPEKGGIVFVRIDSVLNNYDMYHDLRKSYEEDVTKADASLRSKAKAFQRDVTSYQEKIQKGLMTRSEADAESEKLNRRQISLEDEQLKARNELAEKEMVLLNRINDAVVTFIEKYNKEKGYSLIISTTGTSPVLYGNPGLDISAEIIVGLNKDYIATK